MPGVLGGDVRIELLAEGDAWSPPAAWTRTTPPSGDLKIGDYAQEADGSYVSKVPAYTYTDATSSVPIAVYLHVQNRPDCSNLPESADDRPRVSQRL